jgi:hypothetical protein
VKLTDARLFPPIRSSGQNAPRNGLAVDPPQRRASSPGRCADRRRTRPGGVSMLLLGRSARPGAPLRARARTVRRQAAYEARWSFHASLGEERASRGPVAGARRSRPTSVCGWGRAAFLPACKASPSRRRHTFREAIQ